jgi:GTPase SAR1 family protein
VHVEGELFMSKRIVFVLNKYDLINDSELIAEYQQQLVEKFLHYVHAINPSSLKCGDKNLIIKNCFITSAGTYYGVGEWIRALAEILKRTPLVTLAEIEPIQHFSSDEEEEMISDITDREKPFLIENDYLDTVSAKYTKVFLLRHVEICRLTFITPRGNEEAELRFRKQIQQRGYLDLLESSGVRKGDVLKIKSYYQGWDDRYIMY